MPKRLIIALFIATLCAGCLLALARLYTTQPGPRPPSPSSPLAIDSILRAIHASPGWVSRHNHTRPVKVLGWPLIKNQQYGYTIQRPPHWYVEQAQGLERFSNIPFDRYWQGGNPPPGAAEIAIVAFAKKTPTVSLESIDGLFRDYRDRAVLVLLRNGARAYRIESPDPQGVPLYNDITYIIPTDKVIYHLALIHRDVPDPAALEATLDQVVNSFDLPTSQ